MFQAGDVVRLLVGEYEGRTAVIKEVRYYATDNGYWVRGSDVLYRPDQVELVQRAGHNPCGTECAHGYDPVCQHCLGTCPYRHRR